MSITNYSENKFIGQWIKQKNFINKFLFIFDHEYKFFKVIWNRTKTKKRIAQKSARVRKKSSIYFLRQTTA